ncbi:hypothetical protein ACILFN_00250 [Capnocytophaga canimorsus]|uniref:hypothetical protein n=1 Tax=Capnocytophaga canimorsus TaxID=28188 RepID=UPI0037D37F86
MNKVKKEIRKIYFLNGNTTEITYQKPKRIITKEYDLHGNITLHHIEEVIDGKFVVSPKSKIFENQYNIWNKLSNVKVFQNHKMIRQESFFYHHFSQKYISIYFGGQLYRKRSLLRLRKNYPKRILYFGRNK